MRCCAIIRTQLEQLDNGRTPQRLRGVGDYLIDVPSNNLDLMGSNERLNPLCIDATEHN